LTSARSSKEQEVIMVRIHKQYVFEGAGGRADLRGLFGGRRRLVVYHFPFDPAWGEGCGKVSHLAESFARGIVHLPARDTSFAAISPAPIAQIESCRKRLGWTFPWLSSSGNTFNEDFRVTGNGGSASGETGAELPGVSVFLREGDEVFHAYSTYQRRLDALLGTYDSVGVTPLRRLERFPPRHASR
jgi:predicted dithiol-disulfide oxidoreductase (DUF899 family)